MNGYVLDACALIALLNGEDGGERPSGEKSSHDPRSCSHEDESARDGQRYLGKDEVMHRPAARNHCAYEEREGRCDTHQNRGIDPLSPAECQSQQSHGRRDGHGCEE